MDRDQTRPGDTGAGVGWTRRVAARLGAVAAAPLLVIAVADPASAHVTITPSTTSAGAYAVLGVSIPHGCDGSSTTEVTIQIPEGINAVSPTRNALWELEKEVVQLDPPATDSHGNEITERVASVTYRAVTPLPEGQRDVFELSLQLPEEEGATLVFPTVQTCEQGETAWVEVAEPGQDPDELAQPAPTVVVTAAGSGGHASATELLAAADSSGGSGPETSSTDVPAIVYVALGVSVLAVLLGLTCLARQRRNT